MVNAVLGFIGMDQSKFCVEATKAKILILFLFSWTTNLHHQLPCSYSWCCSCHHQCGCYCGHRRQFRRYLPDRGFYQVCSLFIFLFQLLTPSFIETRCTFLVVRFGSVTRCTEKLTFCYFICNVFIRFVLSIAKFEFFCSWIYVIKIDASRHIATFCTLVS